MCSVHIFTNMAIFFCVFSTFLTQTVNVTDFSYTIFLHSFNERCRCWSCFVALVTLYVCDDVVLLLVVVIVVTVVPSPLLLFLL